MTTFRRLALPISSAAVVLFGLCSFLTGEPAGPAAVRAYPAIDFLNSLGVNSSISRRGESLQQTIAAIRYLGIRWIRTGYEGDMPLEDLLELHRQTGVKFSYGLLSGGADISRLLAGGRKLAAAGALLAFEGANEPNNWGIHYQDEAGGKDGTWLPVAKLQADLYRSVKADPQLRTYPVWNISEPGAQTDNTGLQYLKIPAGVSTLMPEGTVYADYVNCHNYFMHPSFPGLYDNQTWNAADPGPACKVDGFYGNACLTWRSKYAGYTASETAAIPKVSTETGAHLGDGLSEEKQGRLFLNLYLAQFARQWSYTAIYLLRDRSDESGNQQFGFYSPDYRPRLAARYLHQLSRILADEGKPSEPGSLAFAIPGAPETVHHLLLQKGNGRFALLVWGEKVTGEEQVSVLFGKEQPQVSVFDPILATKPIQVYKNCKALTLTVGDHPFVLEI